MARTKCTPRASFTLPSPIMNVRSPGRTLDISSTTAGRTLSPIPCSSPVGPPDPKVPVDVLLHLGKRQPLNQLAEGRHGNPPGLFGNHQREAICLLGDAYGGAVAGAESPRKHRVRGKRQEARRGRHALL